MAISVFGNSVDLATAKADLGAGYNYVNTEGLGALQLSGMIHSGDVVVGGSGAIGGVGDGVTDNAFTRLAGADRNQTAQAILSFATAGMVRSPTSVPAVAVGSGSNAQTSSVSSSVLPSSTGNNGGGSGVSSGLSSMGGVVGGSSILSPSNNTLGAIQQATISPVTGINGANVSVLSGLTVDNIIGAFVGIAFLSAIMSIFRRR